VQYGIVAVAAAYVARSYLLAPIDLLVLPRFLPMKMTEYLRQLVSPALSYLVMVAALFVTKAWLSGWVGLLVGTLVGGLTYVLALRVVGANAYREVTHLIREVLRPT
jgi:PST family polysaccharide transporter